LYSRHSCNTFPTSVFFPFSKLLVFSFGSEADSNSFHFLREYIDFGAVEFVVVVFVAVAVAIACACADPDIDAEPEAEGDGVERLLDEIFMFPVVPAEEVWVFGVAAERVREGTLRVATGSISSA